MNILNRLFKLNRVIVLLFLLIFGNVFLSAQTVGYLTVATTTSSAGGNYSPRNIVAIWVEDGSGNFVKTLMAYANTRKTHLNNWQASTTNAGSAYNVVDAISGPTLSSYGQRICVWNGKDFRGNLMADGTYTIKMELTDKNATGNISSFPFVKGPNAQHQTPTDVPSFSNIDLDWKLGVVGISEPELESALQLYPNPTSGFVHMGDDQIISVEVYTLQGSLVLKTSANEIDLSSQADGVYLLRVETTQGFEIKKIIKK
jgi:hypothetical protein